MSWGTFITFALRALPEILHLCRRRAERQDREGIHEEEQHFREALARDDLDLVSVLLERRLREARRVRQRRAPRDPA
ncbi:MAG: hypothetical protein M5U26_16785 [Planctomycetota bacterium]|nr:hypothetical protein [Planctomycetota bacterium]